MQMKGSGGPNGMVESSWINSTGHDKNCISVMNSVDSTFYSQYLHFTVIERHGWSSEISMTKPFELKTISRLIGTCNFILQNVIGGMHYSNKG
jgi:hypothetical protein